MLKRIRSGIIILLFSAVLFFSCTESDERAGNKGKDKEEGAYLTTVHLAGSIIAPGKPGKDLASAETVSTTIPGHKSSAVTPVFFTISENLSVFYGKMKPGEGQPPLSASGTLSFENEDYLVIRILKDKNSIQFYKVKILVDKTINPPITSLDIFQQKYMTYADKVYVTRIATEGGVEIPGRTDAHYVNSTINIESVISNWDVRIRGRGNSTWGMPKKPYRIRGNSRNDLFDRERVRNWALIANYADKSLMRNYVSLLLGRSLESLEFTSNVIFTEVYFNGRYDGLYCLQDHQESGPSRVNVEGFLTDTQGNITDVGFMLELDWLDRNPGAISLESNRPNIEYFTVDGRHWFLKYPQYDDTGFDGNPDFHRQAVMWIKNYVTEAHSAIVNINTGTTFNNLCNRASFIDFFIIDELSKDVDGSKLSVFINKKVGGKLNMGPIWDFDLALGNADYMDYSPQNWWIVNNSAWEFLPWFRRLMRNDAFYEDFRTRYLELSVTNIQYTIDSIDHIRDLIRPAALRNFDRWRILNSNYLWPNPPPVLQTHTFDGQVDYVKNFLTQRNAWITDQLQNRRPIPGVR